MGREGKIQAALDMSHVSLKEQKRCRRESVMVDWCKARGVSLTKLRQCTKGQVINVMYLIAVPDFVELEKCQPIIRAAGCIQPVTYKIWTSWKPTYQIKKLMLKSQGPLVKNIKEHTKFTLIINVQPQSIHWGIRHWSSIAQAIISSCFLQLCRCEVNRTISRFNQQCEFL